MVAGGVGGTTRILFDDEITIPAQEGTLTPNATTDKKKMVSTKEKYFNLPTSTRVHALTTSRA